MSKQLLPGDIVVVKNLIFKNGDRDAAKNGRPCLVLYSDQNTSTILPLTNKLYKNQYKDRYVFYDFGSDLTLINIECVYTIPNSNILYPLRNITKDYFRIISKFTEYHINSNNIEIKVCREKIKKILLIKDSLKPILNERYKQLKIISKNLGRVDSNDDIDPIQAKLNKSKVLLYKKNKQNQSIAYPE